MLDSFTASFRETRVYECLPRAFEFDSSFSCFLASLLRLRYLPALEEYLDRSAIRTLSPEGLIAAYDTGISKPRLNATW